MTIGYVQETISAENTFTDAIEIQDYFNVSVVLSDIKVATVTLQRSYDGGVIWKDRKEYTVSTEEWLEETEMNVLHRIGIKTGDYSGLGNVIVRLSF